MQWSPGVPSRSSGAGTSGLRKKGVLQALSKEQRAKLSTSELVKAYKETRGMQMITVMSTADVMGIEYPNPISIVEMDYWLLQEEIGAVHVSIYCSYVSCIKYL